MKIRKKPYGESNIIGKKVEHLRRERRISQKDFVSKMQTLGVDINPTSYSKFEGQLRIVTDKEIKAIAEILNISIDKLFE